MAGSVEGFCRVHCGEGVEGRVESGDQMKGVWVGLMARADTRNARGRGQSADVVRDYPWGGVDMLSQEPDGWNWTGGREEWVLD